MLAYDLLIAVSVLVFGVVVTLYLRSRNASFANPMTTYLAFHGLVFVFRPIMSRIFDYQALYRGYEFQPTWDDRMTVLLATNLGLVTFFAVSQYVTRNVSFSHPAAASYRGRGGPGGDWTAWPRERFIKPFLIVAALLTPIALYSTFTTWSQRTGSVTSMVRDAATGVAVNTTGNGYIDSAQLLLVPLVVIFAWLFRFRWFTLIPLIAFVVIRGGTGGRGPIIVTAFAMASIYLIERVRKWPEWRSSLLLIGAGVLFSFVLVDRGYAIRSIFVEQENALDRQRYATAPFETMDFGNLEFFEYLVYTIPGRTGTFDWFASNLIIFTEPIPRVLWPDKPVGSPVQFFSLFDYGTPIGMTMSVPGAGWMALGFLGVVIQCAIFALLYGMIYRWTIRNRERGIPLLAGVLLIAATVVTYRDGVLVSILKLSLFYLLPLIMMAVLARAFYGNGRRTSHSFATSDGPRRRASPLETPAERRRRQARAVSLD